MQTQEQPLEERIQELMREAADAARRKKFQILGAFVLGFMTFTLFAGSMRGGNRRQRRTMVSQSEMVLPDDDELEAFGPPSSRDPIWETSHEQYHHDLQGRENTREAEMQPLM